MILDANILIYAVDAGCAQHRPAKDFVEEHLNGETRVGLPWQSLAAFLRIATHPRVMTNPLSGVEATEFVDDWLAAPAAWLPEMNATTWSILRRVVHTYGVTANLVPDAQLAALAIQYGVPVVSADSDVPRIIMVMMLTRRVAAANSGTNTTMMSGFRAWNHS